MKKIITYLVATAISTGLVAASDTFLFDHYSQNFATETAGDWNTVDASGNAVFPTGFNINSANQNLELRGGTTTISKGTGRTMYHQLVATPITANVLKISFLYRNWSTGGGTGSYLYFTDSNKRPIFGIGGDRSSAGAGNAWVPRLPLKFVTLGDSTKNYMISADKAPAISSTEGGFKVEVEVNFGTKTYSFKAQKGTYTELGSPNFVAGSDAVFERTGLPFLDDNATNISWLVNTLGSATANFFTTYKWASIDDISITEDKPFVGNSNVKVNAIDPDGNVVKTRQVETAIGQKYTATTDDLLSFDSNGFYYVYDATGTPSLTTINTAEGATLPLHFRKANSYNGPFTWSPDKSSNYWNETETNFLSSTAAKTAYQNSRDVIFNSVDTTQTIQIPASINLGDKNWIINNGRLIFAGAGAINSTGDVELNLGAADSVQINNINVLTGNVHVKGGYTQLALGALGTAKVLIEKDATLAPAPGKGISITNEVNIADGTELTIANTNYNNQGINGQVTGNGNLKVVAYGQRNEIGSDLSQWGGTKITVVPQAGVTSTQLLQITTDAALSGLANRELIIDSLIQVNGISAVNKLKTASIGALSGSKKATLGALTNILNGTAPSLWKIGGLNTDTEFDGVISDAQYDYTSTANRVHIEKVGTGSLTLTGKDLSYKGNTTVTGGTLILKGRLTSARDTVNVADGAKLIVIGSKETDEIGVTTQAGGLINGDTYISGTLESDGAAFNGQFLQIGNTAKVIAKVRNASEPAINFATSFIEGGTLEISPVGTYNVGDVFQVFSPEAIAFGTIYGQFASVANADQWDTSKLYTDGTVAALSSTAGISNTHISDKKAYFVNDILTITGLQSGEKYAVYNVAGYREDATSKLAKGIHIVVIKGAKGDTSIKAVNF
jgi:autotransporter-associated beta strand repeat